MPLMLVWIERIKLKLQTQLREEKLISKYNTTLHKSVITLLNYKFFVLRLSADSALKAVFDSKFMAMRAENRIYSMFG